MKTCSICHGPARQPARKRGIRRCVARSQRLAYQRGRCCTECDYQMWRGRDWVRSHLLVLGLNPLIHAPSRQRDCASADSATIWRSAAATTKRPQEPHDNIIRPELVALHPQCRKSSPSRGRLFGRSCNLSRTSEGVKSIVPIPSPRTESERSSKFAKYVSVILRRKPASKTMSGNGIMCATLFLRRIEKADCDESSSENDSAKQYEKTAIKSPLTKAEKVPNEEAQIERERI